jgi:hypothetical protein
MPDNRTPSRDKPRRTELRRERSQNALAERLAKADRLPDPADRARARVAAAYSYVAAALKRAPGESAVPAAAEIAQFLRIRGDRLHRARRNRRKEASRG